MASRANDQMLKQCTSNALKSDWFSFEAESFANKAHFHLTDKHLELEAYNIMMQIRNAMGVDISMAVTKQVVASILA